MLQDIMAIKLDIMWESASKTVLTHTHLYFIMKSFFYCFLFLRITPNWREVKKAKQNQQTKKKFPVGSHLTFLRVCVSLGKKAALT